MSKSFY
jgi:hypothetical protein